MTDALLLIAPVGLPLLGAAVAVLLHHRPRAGGIWGGLVVALTTLAAITLFVRSIDGTGPAVAVFGNWPRGFGVGFAARLPGTLLILVVVLVATAAAIYARADIGNRRRRAGHDALTLALVGAVNGALLTTDLFNLYVWFELALVAALGLVTIDRRREQIGGAIRYAGFGMVAATAILAGIALVYGATGTLDMATLAAVLPARPPSVAIAVAAALILGGFALKSGLAPLHVWLPASYAAAPLTVAAVFAALMTKMGFYALMLVVVGVFGTAAGQLLPVLALLAAATMLLCALAALAQTDMRRLIGYHVVAQVGYMAAGASLGTAEGLAATVFYMMHSMIVQANLFLGVGAIRRACGSWDLKRVGGMIRSDRLFVALFAVPMLSLAGIPPLSGFWAKLFVLRAGIGAGMGWLSLVALVAALLTIVSVAALWVEACWKSLPVDRPPRPVPAAMLAGMALLSVATLAIGLYPEPWWRIAELAAATLTGMGSGA
jgi:multicomponent Na+:H+ antiporter subunit D